MAIATMRSSFYSVVILFEWSNEMADAEKVLAKINEMHQRIQDETYYEIFELDGEADAARVSAAYRQLAKIWHVDRFSNYDLGPERAKVQEIFSFINNAHRTLTDEDLRFEYDMEVGDGPNVAELLNAENAFMRGKNLLSSGRFKGAHKLFEQAVEWNPDEAEYRAYYLYTEYMQIEKDEDGVCVGRARAKEIFQELDDINTELPEKDWLLQFMGTVALGLNNQRQAKSLFSEALFANSRNHDVKRQLRLLEMREGNKEESFFDRILSKFRS